MTRFAKLYLGLAVTCRYPVEKEYIALLITDQETLEIEFDVVTPARNSLNPISMLESLMLQRHAAEPLFSGLLRHSDERRKLKRRSMHPFSPMISS